MGQETLRRVLYAFADHDKEVLLDPLPSLDQIYAGNELHHRSLSELHDRRRSLLVASPTHGEHSVPHEQVVQSGAYHGTHEPLPDGEAPGEVPTVVIRSLDRGEYLAFNVHDGGLFQIQIVI